MSKPSLKPRPKNPATLINLRVTEQERAIISALAKKYANGNVSLWLRYAGMNCTPRPKDLK